jgi:drug/metabolite transporter (DMT)-like permease
MIVAAGAFVANDTCMKLVMEDNAPPFQVLVMRGVLACLWCLPIVFWMGHARDIKLIFDKWVLLRSLSETFAVLAFVTALARMPIADLTAISQLSPFFVLAGAGLIWGEKIGPLRIILIAFGILGALLVAQPGSSAASPYALLGFITAVLGASRDLISRKVSANVPALVVTLSTLVTVMSCAAVASVFFETHVMPTGKQGGLMLAAGFLLMVAQFLLYLAYRLAEARAVAPFNYSFTLWAVFSGYVVFGAIPNPYAAIGMALILATGLGVILLEGRTRQGPLPAE